MHGDGGQAPRTEERPEYKTEATEEVIGGQEHENARQQGHKTFFYSFFWKQIRTQTNQRQAGGSWMHEAADTNQSAPGRRAMDARGGRLTADW
jgi:hypothetical protein